jgi:plastocyanin
MTNRIVLVGLTLAVALAVGLSACGPGSDERETGSQVGSTESPDRAPEGGGDARVAATKRVDPRTAGFEISLGEWAVTPEARSLRPGPVTLVITNRGTINHGFEIEADGDHSGPGGGEGFKLETRLLAPGDTVRVRVNLAPGIYEIECFVEGHDDRGMENVMPVSSGARFVVQGRAPARGSDVAIENFEFAPPTLEVKAGTRVTWTNNDPTEHTVTGDDFEFDSGVIGGGERFAARLDEPGTYRYHCSIHPDMTALIEVVQ